MNASPVGIVLAAGKGTRMKSSLPKCLHEIAGLPMVEHVMRAMRAAGIDRIVLVVGHGGELLADRYGHEAEIVWQHEQKGTGHAVLMAREAYGDATGPVVVAAGDTPLLTDRHFARLLEPTDAALTIGTAELDDPTGYGRIVTDGVNFLKIVEQKDATPAEKAITTINTGLYAFDGPTLFRLLPKVGADNAQGEIYLTDVAGLARAEGLDVALRDLGDPEELVGVNDRWQLVEAGESWRRRRVKALVLAGATIPDPTTVYVDATAEIADDVTILPNVHLLGRVSLASETTIGPNCRIKDSTVGPRTLVEFSVVEGATFGADCRVGPFANIRTGTTAADGVKIGDFVETKNADLGEGVKLPHLSYVGDASIGARTNVGAAAIFCNWDGFRKHRTEIGADVFVGSNTTLVAPLTIGDRALLVAGSVVTSDVPDGAGAFGRARQETKEGWADRFRARKKGDR